MRDQYFSTHSSDGEDELLHRGRGNVKSTWTCNKAMPNPFHKHIW